MNFLAEFASEGLLTERVVSQAGQEQPQSELPKINPDMGQAVGKISDKPDDSAGQGEDPTQKADQVANDTMMQASVKSLEAAEFIMAHLLEMCKADNCRYSEEKKKVVADVADSIKGLRESLYSVATMEDYRQDATGDTDKKKYRDVAMGKKQG